MFRQLIVVISLVIASEAMGAHRGKQIAHFMAHTLEKLHQISLDVESNNDYRAYLEQDAEAIRGFVNGMAKPTVESFTTSVPLNAVPLGARHMYTSNRNLKSRLPYPQIQKNKFMFRDRHERFSKV